MKEDLFRKTSLERVTSPDQMDELIRVANPSVWVTLAAIAILLAAVLVWSIFGALPTTISAMGVAENGVVTFYIPSDKAADIVSGMAVQAAEYRGKVTEVGALPLSHDEVTAILDSDYLEQVMTLSDWNVMINAVVSNVPDGSCEIKVTVDSIQPIRFLLN